MNSEPFIYVPAPFFQHLKVNNSFFNVDEVFCFQTSWKKVANVVSKIIQTSDLDRFNLEIHESGLIPKTKIG